MIQLATQLPKLLEHAGVLKSFTVTTSLPLLALDLNYYFTLHTLSPKLHQAEEQKNCFQQQSELYTSDLCICRKPPTPFQQLSP